MTERPRWMVWWRWRKEATLPALALLLALVVGSLALVNAEAPAEHATDIPGESPAGASMALSWWTVDGGGGTSSGDLYAVRGTVGQADAGEMSSGDLYALRGGFWTVEWLAGDVYLPYFGR